GKPGGPGRSRAYTSGRCRSHGPPSRRCPMPRAIQFDDYGPPEVLHLVEVPEATAGRGRIRVAVRAAGVNPIDWKVRSGAMRQAFSVEFPSTPGAEFSGVVDQGGDGVTRFPVGGEALGRR